MSKKYSKAQTDGGKKYAGRGPVKSPEVLDNRLAFSKANYKLTGITFLILITGFILMSVDAETFGFGFWGLTLGPLVLLAGFIFAIFAILFDQKSKP